MKLSRLSRAGLALSCALLWLLQPVAALAQTAAVVNPPVTVGECPTFTDIYGTMVSSGIGCGSNQLSIRDGVHGSMTLAPTILGASGSPAILNTTSGQPLYLAHTTRTGADVSDFMFSRAANYAGGTHGFVNGAIRVLDTVSSGATAFEWGLTSIMDNSSSAADASENVAIYAQAHKRNGGGTWALTAELQDHAANPTTPSVTLEFDLQTKGADANAARVIQDLWGKSDDGNATTITNAMRFNTDANTTFTNGLTFQGATISNAALALGAGQKACFDGLTCANYITQGSNQLHFWANGSDIAQVTALGVNAAALNSTTGGIGLPAGQKLCLDGNSTCNNYLTDTSNVVHIWANATDAEQISALGTTALALNATTGDVGVSAGRKFCLNGNGTCTYNVTLSGSNVQINTPSGTPAAFTALASNLLAVTATQLDSTGRVTVASGQKFCLDASTCANYLSQSAGTITIGASGGGAGTSTISGSAATFGNTSVLSLSSSGAVSGTTGTFSGAVSGTTITGSSTVQGATLTSTGNVVLSAGGKVCLNGSGCTLYVYDTGGQVQIVSGSTVLASFNPTNSVIGAASGGGFAVGFSTGVSCSGSPTASFASVGGIVTHC